MSLIPVRISRRMTLGILGLLILTSVAIFAVITLGGKPRLVAAGTEAAEQSTSAITSELALPLNRIEGTAAAMAILAQTLPRDTAIFESNLSGISALRELGKGMQSISGRLGELSRGGR